MSARQEVTDVVFEALNQGEEDAPNAQQILRWVLSSMHDFYSQVDDTEAMDYLEEVEQTVQDEWYGD